MLLLLVLMRVQVPAASAVTDGATVVHCLSRWGIECKRKSTMTPNGCSIDELVREGEWMVGLMIVEPVR